MLSWLETYREEDVSAKIEPIQVLCYCIRQSLIYPYIRNFGFATKVVVQDVMDILSTGKRTVLRCLLQIRWILDHTTSDTYHYLLNTIYLDDYCTWIQHLEDDTLKQFTSRVKEEVVLATSRSWTVERNLRVGLGLEQLEELLYGEQDEHDSKSSETDTESDYNSSLSCPNSETSACKECSGQRRESTVATACKEAHSCVDCNTTIVDPAKSSSFLLELEAKQAQSDVGILFGNASASKTNQFVQEVNEQEP